MKEFIFNIIHWITFIHSTFHSLQQAKLQFSLQNEVVPLTSKHLQNFPGKKPFLSSPFPYLTTPTECFVFPPDAWPFSFSNASHFDLLCACNHEPLGNWSISAYSLFRILSSTAMVLHGDSLSFSYTSARRSVFLHTMVGWLVSSILSAVNRQASFVSKASQTKH